MKDEINISENKTSFEINESNQIAEGLKDAQDQNIKSIV